MSSTNELSGVAALSICESLLLAMNDHKLLPESEIVGILNDAAETHESVASSDADEEALHRAVARLIRVIIDGGNSVRRK